MADKADPMAGITPNPNPPDPNDPVVRAQRTADRALREARIDHLTKSWCELSLEEQSSYVRGWR